jgi:hypothetical protein
MEKCPWRVGGRLWVKEKFIVGWPVDADGKQWSALKPTNAPEDSCRAFYEASSNDPEDGPQRAWNSARHMPRKFSRITLEITEIRVQRVQEISHEDAIAEGCRGYNWTACSPYIYGPHTDDGMLPQEEFAEQWKEINGRESWKANPWCWCISFRLVSVNGKAVA